MEKNNIERIHKGLHTDNSEQDQPKSTYRFALNAVRDSVRGDEKFVSNEEGNEKFSSFPDDYIPIGKEYIGNGQTVIFLVNLNETLSEIGILSDDYGYETHVNANLGFKIDKQIDATYRLRKGCEKTIYFTDDYNKPRIYNFSRPEKFQNNNGEWDVDKFNLFKTYNNIPIFEKVEITESGQLLAGSYNFSIQYLDEDLNPTEWITTTDTVIIYNDNFTVKPFSEIRGSTNKITSYQNFGVTNKAITLRLTNLDTSFVFYRIGIIQATNGSGQISKVLYSKEISTKIKSYNYTGENAFTEGGEKEIQKFNNIIQSAKHIEQIENRLIFGNTKGKKINFCELQKYASTIKADLVVEKIILNNINSQNNQKRSQVHLEKIGYMPGEIYSFGIVYVFEDGTISPVYHIPGSGKQTVTQMSTDNQLNNVYYTDNNNYSTKDYWGIDYEGKKLVGSNVRHHRFPLRSEINKSLYKKENLFDIMSQTKPKGLYLNISGNVKPTYTSNELNIIVKYKIDGNQESDKKYKFDLTNKHNIKIEKLITVTLGKFSDFEVLEQNYKDQKYYSLNEKITQLKYDFIIHNDISSIVVEDNSIYTSEIFGIKFSNIDKPSIYKDEIIGYYIVRNEREEENKTILDTGVLCPTIDGNKDFVTHGQLAPKTENINEDIKAIIHPEHKYNNREYKNTSTLIHEGNYVVRNSNLAEQKLQDVQPGTSYNSSRDKKSERDNDGFDLHLLNRNNNINYVTEKKTFHKQEIKEIFYLDSLFSKKVIDKEGNEKEVFNVSADNKIGIVQFNDLSGTSLGGAGGSRSYSTSVPITTTSEHVSISVPITTEPEPVPSVTLPPMPDIPDESEPESVPSVTLPPMPDIPDEEEKHFEVEVGPITTEPEPVPSVTLPPMPDIPDESEPESVPSVTLPPMPDIPDEEEKHFEVEVGPITTEPEPVPSVTLPPMPDIPDESEPESVPSVTLPPMPDIPDEEEKHFEVEVGPITTEPEPVPSVTLPPMPDIPDESEPESVPSVTLPPMPDIPDEEEKHFEVEVGPITTEPEPVPSVTLPPMPDIPDESEPESVPSVTLPPMPDIPDEEEKHFEVEVGPITTEPIYESRYEAITTLDETESEKDEDFSYTKEMESGMEQQMYASGLYHDEPCVDCAPTSKTKHCIDPTDAEQSLLDDTKEKNIYQTGTKNRDSVRIASRSFQEDFDIAVDEWDRRTFGGYIDTGSTSPSDIKFPYVVMKRELDNPYAGFRILPYYRETKNVSFFTKEKNNVISIYNGDSYISSMKYMSSVYYDVRLRSRRTKSGLFHFIVSALSMIVGGVLTLTGVGTTAGIALIGFGVSELSAGIKKEQISKVYADLYEQGLNETVQDDDTKKVFGPNPDDDTIQWLHDTITNLWFESSVNMNWRMGSTAGITDFLNSPTGYNQQQTLQYCVDKMTTIDIENNDGRNYQGFAKAEIYEVNPDYKRRNKEKTFYHLGLEYDCYSKCIEEFPNRIHWSEQSFQEELVDNYRIFLPNNYRDIEGETGEITNLFKIQNNLYVHTEEALWHLPQNIQERITNQIVSFIGTGSFFDIPPRLVLDGDNGNSAGSINKWSTLKTPYGVFFVSERQGIIYQFNGNTLKPISTIGNYHWFKNNIPLQLDKHYYSHSKELYPYRNNPSNYFGTGFISTYDSKKERIIFTKKDFIINDELLDSSGIVNDYKLVIYDKSLIVFEYFNQIIQQKKDEGYEYVGIEGPRLKFKIIN